MTTRMLLTDLSEVDMRTEFDVTTLTVHHSKKVMTHVFAFPFSILHKSLVSAHHSFNHCLAPVRVLLRETWNVFPRPNCIHGRYCTRSAVRGIYMFITSFNIVYTCITAPFYRFRSALCCMWWWIGLRLIGRLLVGRTVCMQRLTPLDVEPSSGTPM